MNDYEEIYTGLFNTGGYCPIPCERDVYAAKAFKSIIKENKILSIIDVGAGNGHVARNIHSIDPSILISCADFNNFHKLDYASHINCNLTIQADIEKLLNNSYDILFCLDCLEHLPEDKLDDVLVVFKKISKWLIISVPSTSSVVNGIELHLTIKPKEWWDDLFSKYFKIVDSEVQHGFLFHYTFKPTN